MDKQNIKYKLREAVDHLFNLSEKSKSPDSNTHHKIGNNGREKNTKQSNSDKNAPRQGEKREYADVKRAFEKLGGPSMVDIMKLCGIPDDEKGVNRSYFRKQVKQVKNKQTGSYYQFDEDLLAKVRAAIDIK